jgi:hypothetical protein
MADQSFQKMRFYRLGNPSFQGDQRLSHQRVLRKDRFHALWQNRIILYAKQVVCAPLHSSAAKPDEVRRGLYRPKEIVLVSFSKAIFSEK